MKGEGKGGQAIIELEIIGQLAQEKIQKMLVACEPSSLVPAIPAWKNTNGE